MVRGVCKLCLREQYLRESHYVPAALYPRNVKFEMVSPEGNEIVNMQITSPLLCGDCERRFNQLGESEVIRHIAPKAVTKRFPLHEMLQARQPTHHHGDVRLYRARELGLDAEYFAYFMLSLVWRGAVQAWPKQKGGHTRRLQLGEFEEPIRRYLLGELPFPRDTAVIVIACTDKLSREAWFLPSEFHEAGCYNVRFHGLGVFFRAAMGAAMPEPLRRAACTSPGNWIIVADCEARMAEAFT